MYVLCTCPVTCPMYSYVHVLCIPMYMSYVFQLALFEFNLIKCEAPHQKFLQFDVTIFFSASKPPVQTNIISSNFCLVPKKKYKIDHISKIKNCIWKVICDKNERKIISNLPCKFGHFWILFVSFVTSLVTNNSKTQNWKNLIYDF